MHHNNNNSNKPQGTYSWMTPLCSEAQIHGRTGWKAKPLTRADLDSNLVSMVSSFRLVTVLVPSDMLGL